MTTDRSDLYAAVLKMECPVYLQSLISWSNKAIKSEAVSAVGAFASRLSWTFSMFVSCYNDKNKRLTIIESFGPLHHIRERFTTSSHRLARRFPKALNTISAITSDVTPLTQFVQLPWKLISNLQERKSKRSESLIKAQHQANILFPMSQRSWVFQWKRFLRPTEAKKKNSSHCINVSFNFTDIFRPRCVETFNRSRQTFRNFYKNFNYLMVQLWFQRSIKPELIT